MIKCQRCNSTAQFDRRVGQWFCVDCEENITPSLAQTRARRSGSGQWEIVAGKRLLSRADAFRQAAQFIR